MTQSTAPKIVVSYVLNEAMDEKLRGELARAGDPIVSGLQARGIEVVTVNAADPAESAAALAAEADGVLVLGGADIDPARYGQEVRIDNLWFATPEGDDYEIELVQRAGAAQKPVFGICRGFQLLNVAYGGDLIQDLGPGLHGAADLGDAAEGVDPWTNHEVLVEPGTGLAGMLGATSLDIRSAHHQAVDRVGLGLRVVAQAEDGVVEAVEADSDNDSWVLGVQWHPEEASADPEVLDRLLDGFVSAVHRRIARD